jgi:hypothetical protein
LKLGRPELKTNYELKLWIEFASKRNPRTPSPTPSPSWLVHPILFDSEYELTLLSSSFQINPLLRLVLFLLLHSEVLNSSWCTQPHLILIPSIWVLSNWLWITNPTTVVVSYFFFLPFSPISQFLPFFIGLGFLVISLFYRYYI